MTQFSSSQVPVKIDDDRSLFNFIYTNPYTTRHNLSDGKTFSPLETESDITSMPSTESEMTSKYQIDSKRSETEGKNMAMRSISVDEHYLHQCRSKEAYILYY